MGLGDVGQLAGNGAVQQFFVGEDGLEFLDLPLQIVTFALSSMRENLVNRRNWSSRM